MPINWNKECCATLGGVLFLVNIFFVRSVGMRFLLRRRTFTFVKGI